jgi:predicted XRE-type DNA-binding protein
MTGVNAPRKWRKEMPRRQDNDTEVITHGSGNVFEDLGISLSPEDIIKITIARQITKVISAKGFTQVQVAKIWDVDQGKVSNVTRGRLSGFSTERLMKFLLALGWDVDIRLRPSSKETGHVTIKSEGDSGLSSMRQFA